jgi:prolyl oligopeptidase
MRALFVLSVALVSTLAGAADKAAPDPLAPLGIEGAPPVAPVKPVTETLFGTKITDNYRYMEKLDAQTLGWMKAQGRYTRSVLDAIAPRAELGKRVSAFTGSFGFTTGYAAYGGRDFYQERAPGSDNFDLVVHDAAGTRKLVDVASLREKNGGKPFAINYVLASPDGAKVAVGISEGGSENAALTVYDAKSGARIGGPLERVQFGATSWSADSSTLFYNRLQELKPGDPDLGRYKNSTLDAWDLKSAPVTLYGAKSEHGPKIGEDEFPVVLVAPGAPMAVLDSVNGVQNEQKLWLAPAAQAAKPDAQWKLFADRDDGITALDMRGDEIFLLSHRDAPTFKVLVVKAGEPLASARTLVAALPDRVIEGVHAAADALYVQARQGAYSRLLRIPAGTTTIEEAALPVNGHIGEMFTDPREAGVTIELSSWTTQPLRSHYDPKTKKFTAVKLGTRGDFDDAAYKVSDLQARAKDGVMVPLSLIQPKDAKGPQTAIIEAYGSYGISQLADFSSRRAAAMREGITYAICHVRGGGELGEAWRLGGKDANKHNTWEDIIACSEDLIARGFTSKDKLFIIGGSAGGITMGRAMEERPDLFAGILDLVPDANMLRAEFQVSGPANIPEFGTVTTEQGFKNLFDMDSIQHVRKGTRYPAILITTGLNDPRVSPWSPGKFAATLQAAGTPNPVLLRIDEEAGHGIGSTRAQGDALTADWIAFVQWRAGKAGWRPEAKRGK